MILQQNLIRKLRYLDGLEIRLTHWHGWGLDIFRKSSPSKNLVAHRIPEIVGIRGSSQPSTKLPWSTRQRPHKKRFDHQGQFWKHDETCKLSKDIKNDGWKLLQKKNSYHEPSLDQPPEREQRTTVVRFTAINHLPYKKTHCRVLPSHFSFRFLGCKRKIDENWYGSVMFWERFCVVTANGNPTRFVAMQFAPSTSLRIMRHAILGVCYVADSPFLPSVQKGLTVCHHIYEKQKQRDPWGCKTSKILQKLQELQLSLETTMFVISSRANSCCLRTTNSKKPMCSGATPQCKRSLGRAESGGLHKGKESGKLNTFSLNLSKSNKI